MNNLFETLGTIINPIDDFYNWMDKVNEFDLLKTANESQEDINRDEIDQERE